jgi:hypothetical protein
VNYADSEAHVQCGVVYKSGVAHIEHAQQLLETQRCSDTSGPEQSFKMSQSTNSNTAYIRFVYKDVDGNAGSHTHTHTNTHVAGQPKVLHCSRTKEEKLPFQTYWDIENVATRNMNPFRKLSLYISSTVRKLPSSPSISKKARKTLYTSVCAPSIPKKKAVPDADGAKVG